MFEPKLALMLKDDYVKWVYTTSSLYSVASSLVNPKVLVGTHSILDQVRNTHISSNFYCYILSIHNLCLLLVMQNIHIDTKCLKLGALTALRGFGQPTRHKESIAIHAQAHT